LLQVKRRSGKSFTISVFIGLLGGAVGTALVGLFSGNTNTGDGTLTAWDGQGGADRRDRNQSAVSGCTLIQRYCGRLRSRNSLAVCLHLRP